MITKLEQALQYSFCGPCVYFSSNHSYWLVDADVKDLDDFIDNATNGHECKDFDFLKDKRTEINQAFPCSAYQIREQPYALQYREVDLRVNCLLVREKCSGRRITIVPWYLIPGRRYPVFIILMGYVLHYLLHYSCDAAVAAVKLIYNTDLSHMLVFRSNDFIDSLFSNQKLADIFLGDQIYSKSNSWDDAKRYLSEDHDKPPEFLGNPDRIKTLVSIYDMEPHPSSILASLLATIRASIDFQEPERGHDIHKPEIMQASNSETPEAVSLEEPLSIPASPKKTRPPRSRSKPVLGDTSKDKEIAGSDLIINKTKCLVMNTAYLMQKFLF